MKVALYIVVNIKKGHVLVVAGFEGLKRMVVAGFEGLKCMVVAGFSLRVDEMRHFLMIKTLREVRRGSDWIFSGNLRRKESK